MPEVTDLEVEDPGPPPPLRQHYLLIYLCGRLDMQDESIDALHKKHTTLRDEIRAASRRSDFITISLAVAHGLWVSAGSLLGVFAGSYVIVNHSWYWNKLVAWLHHLL